MNPYKFKSVSLKNSTWNKVGNLSRIITPGINLSFANTIDYAVEKLIGDKLVRSNGKKMDTTNDYYTQETPD